MQAEVTVTSPEGGAAVRAFEAAQARLLDAAPCPVTRHFVGTPAGRVHVLEGGGASGEDPVVLLHGGNSVAAAFQPLLGELARTRRVYAPDRPGCGLTYPFSYRGVDVRRHAVTFLRDVLDGLGLARVPLVGSSMGGYWSLCFALAHPERVSRLVLVGEPAGAAPRVTPKHWLLSTPGVNRLLYATKLAPSEAAVRESHASLLVADVERVSPDALACALAAQRLPGAIRAWTTLVERAVSFTGRSRLTYLLRPELHRLEVPTLFVWGAEDRLGPPSLGQEMAKSMPDARVEVVAQAGHLVWLDAPAETLRHVEGFLGAPTRP